MYGDTLDNKKIKIDILIPIDLKPYVKKAENDNLSFGLLLYPLIQKGELSYGQAANILGVNKYDLIDFFDDQKLPYFTEDPDDLMKDVEKLSNDERLSI